MTAREERKRMYLDEAKREFTHAQLASSDEVEPCTAEEVTALEAQVGALPAAYKEFLLWMGHRAGAFLRGTDVYCDRLAGLREGAQDLLAENQIDAPLPEEAFVFYMHQGYQFMFFRLGAGEDPPIYYYGEGEDQDTMRELYPSFSAFLLTEIAGHARLRAQAEQARAAGRPWTYHHFGEMGDVGTGGNGSSTEGSGE